MRATVIVLSTGQNLESPGRLASEHAQGGAGQGRAWQGVAGWAGRSGAVYLDYVNVVRRPI